MRLCEDAPSAVAGLGSVQHQDIGAEVIFRRLCGKAALDIGMAHSGQPSGLQGRARRDATPRERRRAAGDERQATSGLGLVVTGELG
jgi:hypothetical protein